METIFLPDHILKADGLTKVFDTRKGQVLAVDAARLLVNPAAALFPSGGVLRYSRPPVNVPSTGSPTPWAGSLSPFCAVS